MTNPSTRTRGRLTYHATRPHGILLIGGAIFALAWLAWNLWYTAAIAP